jgi:hypothetical protein
VKISEILLNQSLLQGKLKGQNVDELGTFWALSGNIWPKFGRGFVRPNTLHGSF